MIKTKCFVAIGTNKGNRLSNIRRTLLLLRGHHSITIKKASSIYETEPVGYYKQRDFLNLVIEITTTLSAIDLLGVLKNIEKKLGRTKTFRFGPRFIDLDILFFDKRIIKKKDLATPHPRLHKRLFVLRPLSELAPDLRHPILKKNIRSLLKERLDEVGKKHKEDVRLYKFSKEGEKVHRIRCNYGLSARRPPKFSKGCTA